jgi:hypothetical protein
MSLVVFSTKMTKMETEKYWLDGFDVYFTSFFVRNLSLLEILDKMTIIIGRANTGFSGSSAPKAKASPIVLKFNQILQGQYRPTIQIV